MFKSLCCITPAKDINHKLLCYYIRVWHCIDSPSFLLFFCKYFPKACLNLINLEYRTGLVIFVYKYHKDPKFSDKLVWANSAYPDQTAPRGAV